VSRACEETHRGRIVNETWRWGSRTERPYACCRAGVWLLAAAALAAGVWRPAAAGDNLECCVEGNFVTKILDERWDARALPVAWRMNRDGVINNANNGNTTPLDITQAISIIDQAFGQWGDIPESGAAAVFDAACRLTGLHAGIACSEGMTSTGIAGTDGENIMTWSDPSLAIQGVLAATIQIAITADLTLNSANRDVNGDGQPDISPLIYPDGVTLPAGTIIDTDIAFDAAYFDWVTQPVTTRTLADLYSVTLHEEGHWFGFSHSPLWGPVSTMFPLIDLGSAERQLDQRILKSDDKASARRYYPVEPAFSAGFGTLRGRLLDSAGSPVVGEPVLAIDAVTLDAVAFGVSAHALRQPSAPGTFAVEGLPPGDYFLQVGALDSSFPHLERNRYNLTTAVSSSGGHRPSFVVAAGQETASDDLLPPRRLRVGALAAGGVVDAGDIVVNSGDPSPAPLASATPLGFKDNQAALVDLSALGFAFPFYGTAYQKMFVYDNGYVTFTNAASPAPDPIVIKVSGTGFADESLSEFLTHSPRVGALFRNHDPSVDNRGPRTGVIDVYLSSQSDRVSLTWAAIPEVVLDSHLSDHAVRADTFTLTLFSSGVIDMRYGSLGTPYGTVGITPGGSGVTPRFVDLSRAGFVQANPLEAIVQETLMGSLDFATGYFRFRDGMDLSGGLVRFVPGPGYAYAVTRPDLKPPEVSAPGSSTPLSATGGAPTLIAWGASAPLYNLYRSLLSVLRSTGVYTPTGACLASALAQPNYSEPDAPPVGDGFYYLVSGENAAGMEGTLGFNSAGAERPNTNPCP